MKRPDLTRINDLTADLSRCRRQLSETDNPNAREIYQRLIVRYETVIAGLNPPLQVGGGKAKPAERVGRAGADFVSSPLMSTSILEVNK